MKIKRNFSHKSITHNQKFHQAKPGWAKIMSVATDTNKRENWMTWLL
jgi:hypothetical protein